MIFRAPVKLLKLWALFTSILVVVYSEISRANPVTNTTDHEKATCPSSFSVDGMITFQTFLEVHKVATECDGTLSRLSVRSHGGSITPSVAIGKVITRYGLDVEVRDYCISSCANFIFTAAEYKFVSKNDLVIFHGGMSQDNLFDQVNQMRSGENKKNIGNDAYFEDRANAKISLMARRDNPRDQELYDDVYKLLSDTNLACKISPELCIIHFYRIEKLFFDRVGVNPEITVYGQKGIYQPIYQSDKYLGFYYSVEDLQRFGIDNIVLTDGVWAPHKNIYGDKYYKVEVQSPPPLIGN